MSFDLNQNLNYRIEKGRELSNREIDNNFRFVADPWLPNKSYKKGHIVYYSVFVVEESTQTGTGTEESPITESLAWFRANQNTTRGTFILTEWDMIGGLGVNDISIKPSKGFGKIIINYNDPGIINYNTDLNIELDSNIPSDTLKLVAGDGISFHHNQENNIIKIIADSASGESNKARSINTDGESLYSGKVDSFLEFKGLRIDTSSSQILSVNDSISTNTLDLGIDVSNINIENLSDGNPTLDLLSDVLYLTQPSSGSILQWSVGQNAWIPTDPVDIAVSSLYNSNFTLNDSIRSVTLNSSSSGYLSFGKSNRGIRINNDADRFLIGEGISSGPSGFLDLIANNGDNWQLRLKNIGTGDTILKLESDVSSKSYLLGVDKSSESFGINGSLTYSGYNGLGGLGLDFLSLDNNGNLYVPSMGNQSVGSSGIDHFIPFTSPDEAGYIKGKISTDSLLSYSYDNTSGESSLARQFAINSSPLSGNEKVGLIVSNIPDDTSTQYDYGIHVSGKKSQFASRLETVSIKSHLINDINEILNNKIGYLGQNYNTGVFNTFNSGFGLTSNHYGVVNFFNSDQDLQIGSVSFYSSQSISNSTTRIGALYNVVDSLSSGSLDSVNHVDGIWSAQLIGNVYIGEGGLLLPKTATNPQTNITPSGEEDYEERTLWLSTSGHLHRGSINIESLSDFARDWELETQSITDNSVSIDLVNNSSTGTLISDVLLKGTNGIEIQKNSGNEIEISLTNDEEPLLIEDVDNVEENSLLDSDILVYDSVSEKYRNLNLRQFEETPIYTDVLHFSNGLANRSQTGTDNFSIHIKGNPLPSNDETLDRSIGELGFSLFHCGISSIHDIPKDSIIYIQYLLTCDAFTSDDKLAIWLGKFNLNEPLSNGNLQCEDVDIDLPVKTSWNITEHTSNKCYISGSTGFQTPENILTATDGERLILGFSSEDGTSLTENAQVLITVKMWIRYPNPHV